VVNQPDRPVECRNSRRARTPAGCRRRRLHWRRRHRSAENGHGTAFITFPDYLGQRVEAYSTTVSLTYRDLLPKLTLQLLADNVFDKQYWVVGSESLPKVLQNGRTVSVRMIYRLK